MSAAAVDPGLVVADLTIAYGGNVAVDAASLEAPLGVITGLIGPNGAGKTTMFNACSGLLRPVSGSVHFLGVDVTGASAARRARAGLGRTFQVMQLVDAMSVVENVRLGANARYAGASNLRQVWLPRAQRAIIDRSARDALELCGIPDLAEEPLSKLSTGQRRLVELARVVAADHRLLLLDEPSSGLDEDETRRFGSVLGSLVETKHVGILLVEHDMSLVMSVCEHLFVLEFGSMIFAGSPADVTASPLVRAAYLGSDAEPEGAIA